MKQSLTRQFSDASVALFGQRLSPSEALLEHMLRQTADEDLQKLSYFIHDWVLSNKDRGFERLAEYFDQDKVDVDEAVKIFKNKRAEFCPAEPDDGSAFSMMQLFFLYDCLIHVGAVRLGEPTMCYLDDTPYQPDYFDIDTLLKPEKGKSGKIYNFVLTADGQINIHNKIRYHSELCDGYPIQTAGEICLTHDNTLLINTRSGHYRPCPESIKKVLPQIATAVEKHNPNIKIKVVDDYLCYVLGKIEQKQELASPS